MQKLKVGVETVSNQQSTDFPNHWPGENHEWNLEHFKNVRPSCTSFTWATSVALH
jgi:hypothetical protein